MRYFETGDRRYNIAVPVSDIPKFFDIAGNPRTQSYKIGDDWHGINFISFSQLMNHAKPELKEWIRANTGGFGPWFRDFSGYVKHDNYTKSFHDSEICFSFGTKDVALLFKLAWA